MNRKERRATKRKGSPSSSSDPEVDRLFALALQHHQAGQLSEAILYYQWIVERRPDFVGARNNLGVALMARSKFDEAAAQFQKAIALKPNFIEFYNNLGRAVFAQGKVDEALGALRRALAIGGTPETKSLFVGCARALDVFPDVDDFRELMRKALTEPWSRPSEVGVIVSNLLKQDRRLKPYIERAAAGWPARPSEQAGSAADLAAISSRPLLCSLLESTPVWGVELERFLTATRSAILALAVSSPAAVDADILSFCCALARQCFLNEYVFAIAPGEIDQALALRDALIGNIEAGRPIPDLCIAAVAAYVPLHTLANSGALLTRKRPKPVMDLLLQQVREPADEARLRTTIPALTAVEDDVSIMVRQQYEENPYPRWVKTEPFQKFAAIDQQMRLKFPLSKFRNLEKGGDVDILIAGCGTGRYAIEAAQSFPQARILAIDLSLSSLAYAKRKAQERGLKNVEFAQADILRLGSSGRSFDLIEAGGVLHHLGNPFAGWLVLLSLLRPRGCMRIGLYSEAARRDITATRMFIAERGYRQTADDIRRCRQELMAFDHGTPQRNVAGSVDFFTMSECRDLLFHVEEHRHELPEIARFIDENDMEFLGFEISPVILAQYRARFPDDRAMTDLDCWHIFETENPSTFLSMYEFWVQNKATAPPGALQS